MREREVKFLGNDNETILSNIDNWKYSITELRKVSMNSNEHFKKSAVYCSVVYLKSDIFLYDFSYYKIKLL